MKTVVAVVETGSFTAASERLAMSKALVSKYVGEVEASLGVRLFNRSTRRLALTEAGQSYYQRAVPLLEEFAELSDEVSAEQARPKGLLRISAPVTFGEMKLSPLLPQFLQHNPELQVDLQLSDRMIDMLEEGIDVVIRIGGVDDSSLVARPIATLDLVLVAAPSYLQQRGTPKGASCIAEHQCIIDSNFRIGRQWPIVAPDGQTSAVDVSSRIAVNSPRAVKQIALNGGGIGMIPRFIVADEIASGDLVEVLPGFETLEFGLFAIYPHRRYLAKKVRCFIDFLMAEFSSSKK